MNKNIDLGTFEFDISKVEKQLIEYRKELEQVNNALKINKKALNDDSKKINDLGKKVALLKESQKGLNDMLSKGEISQKDYDAAISETNQTIQESKARINELASAQSAHIKTILEQERAVKELRLESNELNKLLAAGRTETNGSENAYRNLNKELNALKTEAKNLGAELVMMERAGKGSGEAYEKLKKEFIETSAKAEQLNEEFKAIDKSVGDNQRSVGDYTDSIKKAFSEIPSLIRAGDIQGAFSALKGGVGELFQFIKANPILLVLTGIAAMVKSMYEYNAEVRNLNKEVSQIANTTGDVTDQLRINSQAIADTFGKDFAEAVTEQANLMQDFKISAEEAFNVYTNGLALGGAANAEFGDSIREYGALFAQNGYSAQEFINILNSGIDLQIYNDKLPDAIKEAGLSLREQTKSTRDALVNAFGASFSDDILKKISRGEITIKTALEEISKKAVEANLNQQQLAQLTADVFRGAGEDAGGLLVIFEAINHAQGIQSSNLTDLQKQIIELANLNRELGEAKDEAYNSDAVQSFQFEVDVLWKKLQKLYYDFIGWMGQADRAFYVSAASARGAFSSIPEAAGQAFKGVIDAFKAMIDSLKSGGVGLSKLFSGDINGALAAFDRFANTIPSMYGKITSAMKKGATTIAVGSAREAQRIGSQYDARVRAGAIIERSNSQKQAQTKSNSVSRTPSSGSKKVHSAESRVRDQQKVVEDAAKKELELAKQVADNNVDIAKNELAEYVAINAQKLKETKRLNNELYNEQLKYYNDLKALKEKELNANYEKELVGKSEAEKINIKKEYDIKRLDLENEFLTKRNELDKTYTDQLNEDKKLSDAIEFQQRLVDLEVRNANEYEVTQVQAEEQRQNDLLKLEEDRANQLISLENYEAQKKLIESKYAQASKQIEEAKQTAIRQQYADTLGNIAGVFGEQTALGKAAGIAQATINTYQGATEVLKSPTLIPEPFGTPAKFVNVAAVIATGLKTVSKIAGVKGFAQGGIINGGARISRANGDNRLITAKDGEVVLTQEQQAKLGGASVFKSIGVPGFNGISGGNLATVQKNIVNNDFTGMADMISKAVAEGAALGTKAGSKQGISELSDNRRIASSANF